MGKSTSTHLVRLARTHILAWTPFSSTSMFDRPEYSTSNPLHQYTGHTNQRTETIPSLHLQSLSLPRATKDERDRETKDCLTDYLQTSRRDRENYVFTNVASPHRSVIRLISSIELALSFNLTISSWSSVFVSAWGSCSFTPRTVFCLTLPLW